MTSDAAAMKRAWDALVHTDHPTRHWDRTCPACISSISDSLEDVATDDLLKRGDSLRADIDRISAELLRRLPIGGNQ